MAKNIFFLLVLASGLNFYSQSFEGEIAYKLSSKSKTPRVTNAQWQQMLGTRQNYFIKKDHYKSLTNGVVTWQIYSGKDNKLYSKMRDTSVVYWKDASIENEEVISTKQEKNVDTILGYVCHKLIITCKKTTYTYYYAPQLAVDVELYKLDKYYNWYYYLSIAKALSLRTVIENEQLFGESIATEVKPMKLDDKVFEIPKNTKVVKSPF